MHAIAMATIFNSVLIKFKLYCVRKKCPEYRGLRGLGVFGHVAGSTSRNI